MKAPDLGNGISNGAKMALAHASQKSQTPQASQSQGQFQLKKLRGRHHLILELAARGMKQVDIAKAVGVTEVTVSYTVNSELGKQKLAVLRGQAEMGTIDVVQEFANLAPAAVETLEGVMLSDTAKDSDKISAADKILNGAGFAKKQSLEINVHHVTDEEIQAAKLAAREKGRLVGTVIEDAEVIEVTDKTNG